MDWIRKLAFHVLFLTLFALGHAACSVKLDGKQDHNGKVEVGLSQDMRDFMNDLKNGVAGGASKVSEFVSGVQTTIRNWLGPTGESTYVHPVITPEVESIYLDEYNDEYYLMFSDGGYVVIDFDTMSLSTEMGTFTLVRSFPAENGFDWIFELSQGDVIQSIHVELSVNEITSRLEGSMTIRIP